MFISNFERRISIVIKKEVDSNKYYFSRYNFIKKYYSKVSPSIIIKNRGELL